MIFSSRFASTQDFTLPGMTLPNFSLPGSLSAVRDAQALQSALTSWYGTEQGRYVLHWEQTQIDVAVTDVFGFHALQLGLPDFDFLRESRIPLRMVTALGASTRAHAPMQSEQPSQPSQPLQPPHLLCETQALPLASQSMDLVLLPHVLEFSSQPHAILREAERVLRPEGQIVITGFNPLSLWGLRRALPSAQSQMPFQGQFIGLHRLKDWLTLLGLELNGGRFGCYAPPFAHEKWLSRSAFMEKAGDRWWPIAGAVYAVRAIKRVVGARMVTPAWRQRRAAAPGLVQVARRENVIHVRPSAAGSADLMHGGSDERG
jgi:SAM-dependent methyltransferase